MRMASYFFDVRNDTRPCVLLTLTSSAPSRSRRSGVTVLSVVSWTAPLSSVLIWICAATSANTSGPLALLMMKAGREPAANGPAYDALVAAVTSIEREALSAPTPTLIPPAWVLSGSTTRSGWMPLQVRQTRTSGPSMAVATQSVASEIGRAHV